MKILIVGGKGIIGSKVSAHFSKKHKVIIAGRNSGDVNLDMTDSGSIKDMLVKAAYPELKDNIRINVVSSGLVKAAVVSGL